MNNSADKSAKLVRVRSAVVPKYDVPLGRVFVEDGRVYQATVNPGTYRKVADRARFRYRDRWFVKDGTAGAMLVEPNMPFGKTSSMRRSRLFMGSEPVSILQIEEMVPEPK